MSAVFGERPPRLLYMKEWVAALIGCVVFLVVVTCIACVLQDVWRRYCQSIDADVQAHVEAENNFRQAEARYWFYMGRLVGTVEAIKPIPPPSIPSAEP
jgi:hypothetical protein